MIVILYENIKVTKNTKLVGAWASDKLYIFVNFIIEIVIQFSKIIKLKLKIINI